MLGSPGANFDVGEHPRWVQMPTTTSTAGFSARARASFAQYSGWIDRFESGSAS
jgi:hypothetical protein